MMGNSHAVSGALVWLGGCALANALGAHVGWQAELVGTPLCAGWAVAPDLDHRESLIANCGGPPTRWVAAGVAELGVVVHEHTKTRWDRADEDGHRTITHTLVWAAGCYVVGSGVGRYHGQVGAAVLVFLGVMLGLHAALPKRWRHFDAGKARNLPAAPLWAAGAAGVAYFLAPHGAWWLGLACGAGCFVHCLGDSLTNTGCPWLWPVPISAGRDRDGRRMWKTWYLVGTPEWMRFSTGGHRPDRGSGYGAAPTRGEWWKRDGELWVRSVMTVGLVVLVGVEVYGPLTAVILKIVHIVQGVPGAFGGGH